MRAATVFNFLIEASLMGSVMIVLLLLVRRFLRPRLGSRLICFAWLLVAARLLIPLALPNPMMNELRPAWSDNIGVRPIADQVRVRATDALADVSGALGERGPNAAGLSRAISEFNAEISYGHMARWLLLAYAVVALLVTGWMVWQNARFMRKLKRGRVEALAGDDLRGYIALCGRRKVRPVPVYWVDPLPSACLVGAFRPYIALPLTLDRKELMQVLTHEICHKKAGDHWWGLVRDLCCATHWLNPLVWLAARLSRTDVELACDERVIAPMNDGERIRYANTLALAAARRNAPEVTVLATGMTMKGRHIKQRVQAIVDGRAAVKWLCVAALIVAGLGTLFAFATAEYVSPLAAPVAPRLQGPAVGPRAIRTEQDAIQYAMDILSSGPYLNAESLSPFNTFDMLEWQVKHVGDRESIWYVYVWPKEVGAGGAFTMSFDESGKMWQIRDENACDRAGNRKNANPTYRTHAQYSAMICDYVRQWARLILPDEDFDALYIESDYMVDGKRRLSVRYSEGYMDRGCYFYIQAEPELYVYRFERWDGDNTAQIAAHNEAFEHRRRELTAWVQRNASDYEAEFLPLSAMDEDTELYEQAMHGFSCLTEVYGYLVRDAERFEYALVEQNGEAFLIFHDAEHPNWNYVSGAWYEAMRTPFTCEQGSYGGEGGIRYLWDTAEEKGWLERWQEDDRDAFVHNATDYLYGIPFTDDMKASLRAGELSAAQAVQAAFEANYGPPDQWSEELAQWRDAVLARFGLSGQPFSLDTGGSGTEDKEVKAA